MCVGDQMDWQGHEWEKPPQRTAKSENSHRLSKKKKNCFSRTLLIQFTAVNFDGKDFGKEESKSQNKGMAWYHYRNDRSLSNLLHHAWNRGIIGRIAGQPSQFGVALQEDNDSDKKIYII